jgi:hypothetical protein
VLGRFECLDERWQQALAARAGEMVAASELDHCVMVAVGKITLNIGLGRG